MAVGFVPVWYSKQALNDIPAVLPATIAARARAPLHGRGAPPRPGARRADGRPRGQHEVHGRRDVPRRRRRHLAALAVAVRAGRRRARRRGAAQSLADRDADPRLRRDAESRATTRRSPRPAASEVVAPLYYLNSFAWGLGLPAALLAVVGLVLAARTMPRRLLVVALPAIVLADRPVAVRARLRALGAARLPGRRVAGRLRRRLGRHPHAASGARRRRRRRA